MNFKHFFWGGIFFSKGDPPDFLICFGKIFKKKSKKSKKNGDFFVCVFVVTYRYRKCD